MRFVGVLVIVFGAVVAVARRDVMLAVLYCGGGLALYALGSLRRGRRR